MRVASVAGCDRRGSCHSPLTTPHRFDRHRRDDESPGGLRQGPQQRQLPYQGRRVETGEGTGQAVEEHDPALVVVDVDQVPADLVAADLPPHPHDAPGAGPRLPDRADHVVPAAHRHRRELWEVAAREPVPPAGGLVEGAPGQGRDRYAVDPAVHGDQTAARVQAPALCSLGCSLGRPRLHVGQRVAGGRVERGATVLRHHHRGGEHGRVAKARLGDRPAREQPGRGRLVHRLTVRPAQFHQTAVGVPQPRLGARPRAAGVRHRRRGPLRQIHLRRHVGRREVHFRAVVRDDEERAEGALHRIPSLQVLPEVEAHRPAVRVPERRLGEHHDGLRALRIRRGPQIPLGRRNGLLPAHHPGPLSFSPAVAPTPALRCGVMAIPNTWGAPYGGYGGPPPRRRSSRRRTCGPGACGTWRPRCSVPSWSAPGSPSSCWRSRTR
ncbi:hypothetical protein SGPA1_12532 [Streptomyces misionensis JCM 4497]